MGEVIDFASARRRLERIQAVCSKLSPLQQKVSASDELKAKITSHSTCTYWPIPGSPVVLVSFPLIAALSSEAVRSLSGVIVTIGVSESDELVSYRCYIRGVRQETYQLQLQLTLREASLSSRFEIGVMCGEIVQVSFALSGFSVVRDRLRREAILPF